MTAGLWTLAAFAQSTYATRAPERQPVTDPAALFAGRFTRPIDLSASPRFLSNPCEAAPVFDQEERLPVRVTAPAERVVEPHANGNGTAADAGGGTLEVVRRLVARRAELPAEAVGDGDRLLGDLHLTSIGGGEPGAEAGARAGRGASRRATGE